ncbi:MAG: hypothetical protein ACFFBD_04480 [Candidatus Hodarchaeota archaeon]
MRRIIVLLGTLIIVLSSLIIFAEFVSVPVLNSSSRLEIPVGALFFYLNSSSPTDLFKLAQFVPDQSFIGHYNVEIDLQLWLADHQPECEVLCRNLWNASDLTKRKSTEDDYHSTFSYFYSRPTIGDPDFAVCLALDSEISITTPVEGWVYMIVAQGGTTERPSGFTMPEHLTNCTAQTHPTLTSSSSITPSSSSSSGTQSVSLLGVVSITSLSVLLLWKKRAKRKK